MSDSDKDNDFIPYCLYGHFDKDKNCHSYCRFGHVCKYAKGEKGRYPEDCGTYYLLEDIEMEAREIAMEERRARFEVGEDW